MSSRRTPGPMKFESKAVKRTSARHAPLSSPGLTGRPGTQRPRVLSRTSLEYWVPACAGMTSGVCGRDRGRGSVQRLQSGLDLGAPRLEERRQRQFLAEALHRLVRCKARTVGGDLEQDAVRLAKIQAAEIEPVDGT